MQKQSVIVNKQNSMVMILIYLVEIVRLVSNKIDIQTKAYQENQIFS